MDRATVIANWGRQPGEPMSDEQRRAMFWRMSQGGGGTWSQRPTAQDYNNTLLGSAFGLTLGALGAGTDYGLGIVDGATAASYLPKIEIVPQGRTPEEVKATMDALKASGAMETGAWAKFKAAAKGFWEGTKEGAINVADKYTFEAIDGLHEKALEGDSVWSKRLAGASAFFGHWAMGAGIYTMLGAAFQAAKTTPWGFKAVAAIAQSPKATSIARHSKLLTAIGGFMAQDGIEEYRKGRALNPYWDKALAMTAQGAGFVGSMAGIGAAGQYIGGAMRAIPVSTKLTPAAKKWISKFMADPAGKRSASLNMAKSMTPGRRLSLLGAAKVLLTGVDKSVKAVVGTALKPIGYVVPTVVKTGAKKLHSVYTAFSEFTGSTIKEIVNMPKTLAKLGKANQLMKTGAAKLTRADSMKVVDAFKVAGMRRKAADQLAKAAAQRYAGNIPRALRFERAAAGNTRAAAALDSASKTMQAALRSEASRLGRQAGYLRANAQSALQKAAYVAGISSAVTAVEERGLGPKGSISEYFGMGKGIAGYQADAYGKYQRGESFEQPVDTERPLLGKIAVGAAGSTGNPIEKLFRSNWAGEQAEVGAYRAKLQIVDEQEKAGILTKAQAKAKREEYAQNKPFKMQGRGIWDIATAFGSFTNWKVKEAIDKAKRTTFQTVRTGKDYLHDADTVMTKENPKGIRASRYNAPEVTGIEKPWGDQARDFARDIIKPGQKIIVVEDSHPKARIPVEETTAGIMEKAKREGWSAAKLDAELSKWRKDHGRPVASYETLPAGLGWTAKVPYLRRATALLGRDVGERLVKAGHADMRYEELSGPTDKDAAYGKAREKPRAANLNIWSPEARAAMQWVGEEQSPEEKRAAQWAKDNPGKPMPPTDATDFNTKWGSGLMWTGNSRAFSAMPRVGLWAAQLWNLSLAFRGVQEHTEKAQARAGAPAYTRTEQRDTSIKTPEQIRIDSLMESIRAEYGR